MENKILTISEDLPKIVLNLWVEDFMNVKVENIRESEHVVFYKEQLKKYRKYEIDVITLCDHPFALAMGGINSVMTFEEMKTKIKQKFQAMKELGLIITSVDFEKIKNDYYPLPRTNLTRIWCADYLKNESKAFSALNNHYDVPGYIIVLNDPDQETIKLKWFFSDLFPLAQEIQNACIYFKEVKGKGAANPRNEKLVRDIGPESEIGFTDFGDLENIIKENETGKYYIVDTELKSFKFSIKGDLLRQMIYARYRFVFVAAIILLC